MNPNNITPDYTPQPVYIPSSTPNNGLSKQKIIIGLGIALLLLLVLALLSSGRNGALEVSVPNTIPKDSEVDIKVQPDGGAEKSFKLKAGESKKIRLSPGSVRIDAQADDRKSIDIVMIEKRKTTKLNAPSGQIFSAKQFGSNTQACPLLIGGAGYSYDCGGNDTTIVRHVPGPLGTSTNTVLFNAQQFSAAVPYKNGLLAIKDKKLVYVDVSSNTITVLPLNSDIQAKILDDTPLIATAAGNASAHFALSFPQKEIYLFKDQGDTNPTSIKLGLNLTLDNPKRNRMISMYGDTLVVFSGYKEQGLDAAQESTENLPKGDSQGYVFEYDTNGNLTKTIKTPKDTTPDAVEKLSSEYYIATTNASSSVFHATGDGMELMPGMEDIGSHTVGKDKAYVQVAGTLYEFTQGTGKQLGFHSVFSTPILNVSELFTGSNGELLFSAAASDDSTASTRIYQLTNQVASSGENGSKVIPIVQGEPSYKGFDPMIEEGVTNEQIESTKIALSKYFAALDKPVAIVEISDVDVVAHDRNSTSDSDIVNFAILYNGNLVKAKLEYSGSETARVYLYDMSSNKQLFDSGPVTSS
jgi:hypothetical protein